MIEVSLIELRLFYHTLLGNISVITIAHTEDNMGLVSWGIVQLKRRMRFHIIAQYFYQPFSQVDKNCTIQVD